MSKRIALVGYGYWGPNLLRNLIANQDCEVVYCCDKEERKLQRIHRIYPGLTLTNDIEVVLGDQSIDAVVLVTPTATHFPLAKRILESGKDVLIEKPMTSVAAEAKSLVSIANKNKRIIMVDHTFLFNDAVMKIKQLIKSGEIGDVLYIDSVRVSLGLFQKDVNVIFDLAAHDFSIINYILGTTPVFIQASADTHFGVQEDVAYISAEYPKKVSVHVHVSWLSPAKIRRMLIVGSKKMIVYDDIEPTEKIKVYDKGVIMEKSQAEIEQSMIGYRSGDVWLPKIDIVEPLSLLVGEFINVVETRKVPESGGEFGLQVVEILEEATRSARDKKKIRIRNKQK